MKEVVPVSAKEQNTSPAFEGEESCSAAPCKGYEARTKYPKPLTKGKERRTESGEDNAVIQKKSAAQNNAGPQSSLNFTPYTITANGFEPAAASLSANITDENVKNNARIMVVVGTRMNVYDGAAKQLTAEKPIHLTREIELPNGVYKSLGNPPFFYRIYHDDNGQITYTKATLTNQQGPEDMMLQDIVLEGDQGFLNRILGQVPHWFLVLPGGAGGTGKANGSVPQWASAQTPKVLQTLGAMRGSQRDGANAGTEQAAQSKVPEREIPDRIVPWSDEHGVHANIWANGAHTTIALTGDESDEDLEQRVRNVTGKLRDSTDASQSTTVVNGAKETGFQEPAAESRQQDEQAGSGKVTDPQQERQEIRSANGIANWPAYPAKINNYGADISVTGASNRMAMEIDYSIGGSDLLSSVTNRMQHINYFWEIFDVTKVKLPNDIASVGVGAGEEVSPGSGVANKMHTSMYANYEDQKADLSEMAGVSSLNPALWPVRAAQLSLIAVSASVRTIGTLVSSYVSIVTAPINERNIGWDREGDFIVRCVATPSYKKNSPNRRASSVAVKPVRIMNVNKRADQEVTRDKQELATLKHQLASVQPGPSRDLLLQQIADRERIGSQTTMENVAEQLSSARQRLGYAKEIVKLRNSGEEPPAKSTAVRLLKVQLELNGINPEEFRDYIAKQVELLKNMQGYGNQMVHGLKPPVYQPRVVLASEENGQVSQMVMMLGETADSTDKKRKYRLIDLTSPSTQGSYEGESNQEGVAGHSQAITNAFYHFRDNSEYGRGTIAIRLPENMPAGITVEQNMRSRPGSGRRWMQRLADLATAAEVAGLLLTGPAGMAVGMLGGVAGAAVAIEGLMRKKHSGRFRWDFQTVMDITGIVGGAVPFLGLYPRMQGVAYYMGIAQLGQSALSIPVKLDEQLKAIQMDMVLPPGEKAARSAEAFLQGVKSGAVLIVSAQQMAVHGAPEKHAEPAAKSEPLSEGHSDASTTSHPTPEAVIPEIASSVTANIESTAVKGTGGSTPSPEAHSGGSTTSHLAPKAVVPEIASSAKVPVEVSSSLTATENASKSPEVHSNASTTSHPTPKAVTPEIAPSVKVAIKETSGVKGGEHASPSQNIHSETSKTSHQIPEAVTSEIAPSVKVPAEVTAGTTVTENSSKSTEVKVPAEVTNRTTATENASKSTDVKVPAEVTASTTATENASKSTEVKVPADATSSAKGTQESLAVANESLGEKTSAKPVEEQESNQKKNEEVENEQVRSTAATTKSTVQEPGAANTLRARIKEILGTAKLSEDPNMRDRATEQDLQLRALIYHNPDLISIARSTLTEAGNFKQIREMVRNSFFGDTPQANQIAQKILQEVRIDMANKAIAAASRFVRSLYPELKMKLIDMGNPGFASDRDITLQFEGGGSVQQRIDASLQAVRKAYDTLRSQGIEPDAVLDTNFYTELHESSVTPASTHEAAQIQMDQSVVSLSEMRMGMKASEWAAYRKAQIEKFTGAAEPNSKQPSLEAAARTRIEAELNAAEALAARLRPEGQAAQATDALLTQKREDLSAAMMRNAAPREIRQLMAEIKLLEPEAYGTRAAVESVPGRQQAWARGGAKAYMTEGKVPQGRLEKLSFHAQDASAHAGMLFGHSKPSSNELSSAPTIAKHIERVAHAVETDAGLKTGTAAGFLRNVRKIVEAKKIATTDEANAAILGELKRGLEAEGYPPEVLEGLSDKTVTDLWVAKARDHALNLVLKIRTAEQMAHASEGTSNPSKPAAPLRQKLPVAEKL